MKKHAQVGLFVFTITASGLALADCPVSMPEQLLVDCITYEGSGSTFPTSDYAHMAMYNDWQKAQQSRSTTQLTGDSKNIATDRRI
jgi:hypothetical protein